VPPDTFNLIRTNTLLLEDIKTCTSCRIFIAEATQPKLAAIGAGMVELVGSAIQIEGAVKCFQDLTAALNLHKKKVGAYSLLRPRSPCSLSPSRDA